MKYTKCLWCDWEGDKKIWQHISKCHGKSREDYALKVLGLEEIPKCPICGKDCKLHPHELKFKRACSRSCTNKLKFLEGDHNFNKLDFKTKSEISKRVVEEQLRNGNHPFQSGNLPRDSEGRSIRHSELNRSLVDSGNHSYQKSEIDPSRKSTLYLGVFGDRVKVGRSRNLRERIDRFRRNGIVFSDMYTLEGDEMSIHSMEVDFKKKFKDSRKPLCKEKYPNPNGISLGHTEYFDMSIYSDALEFIKSHL